MRLLRTVEELRSWRDGIPGAVGLVPTMGALHAGHLSHLSYAREAADRVVASIYVNPTQFGPGEDFTRYPRDLDDDVAKCEAAGAEAVFAPADEAMYPPGAEATPTVIDVPSVSGGLEGAQRPGHFGGVCRVVMKLLQLVRPDAVTFGRKDYQQLCVVRAMIEDLMVPVRVVEVPTTREADGLAMSSRNRYLDEAGRKRALGLSKALRQGQRMAVDGEADPAVIESMMAEVMRSHGVEVDYAAVRRARTLAEVDHVDFGGAAASVALVAGRVEGGGGAEGMRVRLLDNLPLGDGAD
ncbi:MAG: pantoate--beta-alanine ligase [Planctomycetota bacterium]